MPIIEILRISLQERWHLICARITLVGKGDTFHKTSGLERCSLTDHGAVCHQVPNIWAGSTVPLASGKKPPEGSKTDAMLEVQLCVVRTNSNKAI